MGTILNVGGMAMGLAGASLVVLARCASVVSGPFSANQTLHRETSSRGRKPEDWSDGGDYPGAAGQDGESCSRSP
jgi:hypothetical protein